MIHSHDKADSSIADAIWWLHGFAAAKPKQGARAASMASSLSSVRHWLNDLAAGTGRVLGLCDRQMAVVITEAELERLSDGLRAEASGDDVAIARGTINNILNQWKDRRTQQRLGDPDLPF